MAWNQRTSDHFQRFAKAKHIQSTEDVRGDSSSASARSFIPKVNVGVAPYEGAATTERKGSVVPKVAVGVAQRGGRHRPRPGDLSPSPLTRQTRRTPKSKLSRRQWAPRHQLLPPIPGACNSGAPYIRHIDWSCNGSSTESATSSVPHRLDNPGYGRRQPKLQQRSSSGLPVNRPAAGRSLLDIAHAEIKPEPAAPVSVTESSQGRGKHKDSPLAFSAPSTPDAAAGPQRAHNDTKEAEINKRAELRANRARQRQRTRRTRPVSDSQ